MKPEKNMEQQLTQLADAIGSRDAFVDDVMNRIESSPVQPGKKSNANVVHRRMIMKRITKFSAAAVILIGVFLSLTILNKTVTRAYALEDTINALHSVRTIHIREYHSGNDEPILIWAQFLPNGKPKQIRLNIPEWDSPADGAKEIVWKNNKAQVWFKKKNSILTVKETKLAEQIKSGMEKADPKLLLEKLKRMQQDGKIQLSIDQPEDIATPITVTAVFAEPDPLLGKQLTAKIDQATRLVLSLELNLEIDNTEKLLTMEYFDYNQPFSDDLFSLTTPEDLLVVDQTTNVVGLAQGNMTNDQVAIEVVRGFWQAIIDKDYTTAGQLYDGIPADKLKQGFGKFEMYEMEILTIGPIQPHPNPKTRGVIVSCTIRFTVNGETIEQTFDKIGVRQVYNQPDRWTIFGGL